MFYGRNNSSNNWQIKIRTHLQNQLFSKTDTCEPSSEFSSSFTVSVSLVIRVAIQISRVFRFQPTLSDASSIPPRGRRPRKHSIPLKLCSRSKKLSRWTENSKGYKNPWPKKTGIEQQTRLGESNTLPSPIPTVNPQRVRKKKSERHSDFHSDSCVWFHVFMSRAAVWFTRFYEYGYLVQFLLIPLAMRRNPLHTHVYIST